MKKNVIALAVVGMLAVVAALAATEGDRKVSVKTLPPVVVKTVPQSGDTQVDAAATKEIRVTFSKKMADRSWSWSNLSDDTQLPIKEVRYDKDGVTCIATVELQPGKTYVSWLNSEKFGNFKDQEGQSAVPYLLVFETKP